MKSISFLKLISTFEKKTKNLIEHFDLFDIKYLIFNYKYIKLFFLLFIKNINKSKIKK